MLVIPFLHYYYSEITKSTGGGERRRRPRTRKPQEPKTESEEPREPREPRVSVPVPNELIGKVAKGTVSFIKTAFGFIELDDGDSEKPREGLPRIYFKRKDFTDEKFQARRGYLVTFTVSKDEDKIFASDVKLTTAGQASAVAINEVIAKKKEEAKALKAQAAAEKKPATTTTTGENGDIAKKARRPRKSVERVVKVKVTSDGKSEEVTIDLILKKQTKLGQVKAIACKAIDVPLNYNIYSQSNGESVFFTKAILNKLQDGGHIHLKEGPEKEEPANN